MPATHPELLESIRTVAVDPTATRRAAAIYHRNIAQRIASAFPEGELVLLGESTVTKEELVVLARSVRRLSPAGVHRFFILAKSQPSPDEGPGIVELFRAGAVDGAATTVLEQTDEPWVRDGLAQAVASLGRTEDDPAPVLVGFPVALRPALERARAALELAWPEAWEEHHALIRYLVYADAPQLRSATTGSTFGAVYVGVDEAADPLRMFQVLLHETGHHALDLRDKFTSFLANPDALASHPLRNDPRPLRGVLHAAFALWRMAEGLRRYAHCAQAATADDPLAGHPWREQLETLEDQLAQTLRILDSTADWTPAGEHLRRSLSRRTPVPVPVAAPAHTAVAS